MRVSIGESFTPRNDTESIRTFKADVAPVDEGGECSVTRTSGSGATMVSVGFPQRKNAQTTMTIMFDSAGHLIRFAERRGATTLPPMTGLTDAQRDSTLRASHAARRSTSISLDYAIDQAVVTNMGGGQPTQAIISNVRTIEKLESLGRPRERLDRVRKLCGV